MLLFAALTVISFFRFARTDSLLEAVYWEVKPFIFTNENGILDGIIPKMFSEGQHYCGRDLKNSTLLSFVRKETSRKVFYDLLRSDVQYGTEKLSEVHKEKAFWGPILSYAAREGRDYEKKRGLLSFQLMKSNRIAVIVPRYIVALPNKILRGILSCQQIIVIALLLAVLFGIIMWMLERFKNDDFPKSFIEGAGAGIWWSLISMTTVGYGDIVPKSLPGRTVALVWVFIGVMIACVMTATTTEIVTGVDDLRIRGKKVAVLENSLEAKIAADYYRVKIVPAKSYEEALLFVRQGKVFAAMINADVAAWYQDEIHDDNSYVPLRVIKKLPASLNINCLIVSQPSEAVRKIFRCMVKLKEEVYTYSVEHFQRFCVAETLYVGSFGELFTSNVFISKFFLVGQ